jgi:hypothetical protein
MKNNLTLFDIINMSKMVGDRIAEHPESLPIIEKMAHVKILPMEECVNKHFKDGKLCII